MDVKTVCLGMLTAGEASGYDLKKRFESSFGHFFPAGFGSIYPALAYLAETKLVTCTEIPQDGKPDRKVYRITKAGKRRFMEALGETRPTHKVRSEFLAVLYFAQFMTEDQISGLLDSRLGSLDELVAMLERCSREDAGVSGGVRFVTGFGLATARAARKYIEENRHLLERRDAKEPDAATG